MSTRLRRPASDHHETQRIFTGRQFLRTTGNRRPRAQCRVARRDRGGPPQNISAPADGHAHGAPASMRCSRPLKRVFDPDLEHFPQCGGALKIIAALKRSDAHLAQKCSTGPPISTTGRRLCLPANGERALFSAPTGNCRCVNAA